MHSTCPVTQVRSAASEAGVMGLPALSSVLVQTLLPGMLEKMGSIDVKESMGLWVTEMQRFDLAEDFWMAVTLVEESFSRMSEEGKEPAPDANFDIARVAGIYLIQSATFGADDPALVPFAAIDAVRAEAPEDADVVLRLYKLLSMLDPFYIKNYGALHLTERIRETLSPATFPAEYDNLFPLVQLLLIILVPWSASCEKAPATEISSVNFGEVSDWFKQQAMAVDGAGPPDGEGSGGDDDEDDEGGTDKLLPPEMQEFRTIEELIQTKSNTRVALRGLAVLTMFRHYLATKDLDDTDASARIARVAASLGFTGDRGYVTGRGPSQDRPMSGILSLQHINGSPESLINALPIDHKCAVKRALWSCGLVEPEQRLRRDIVFVEPPVEEDMSTMFEWDIYCVWDYLAGPVVAALAPYLETGDVVERPEWL